jgi:uncharacterized protein involved in exopolysaccharide biosynthesis
VSGHDVTTSPVPSEVSLLRSVAALARHLRLVIACCVIPPLLVAAHGKSAPTYRASVAIMPSDEQSAISRMTGLAAQLGLRSQQAGSEGLDFYAALFNSREVLAVAARAELVLSTAHGDTARTTFVEMLGVEATTEAEVTRRAVKALRQRLRAERDFDAGMLRIALDERSPIVAEELLERLVDIANGFNVDRRRSKAAAERAFAQQRVEETRAELRHAERALEQFLASNRAIETPSLAFQYGRLQREVEYNQRLHSVIAELFEQARLDEVRNTPVFTVVEHARGSAERVSVVRRVLLAAMVGTLFGLACALTLALVQLHGTRDPHGVAELRRVLKRAVVIRVPGSRGARRAGSDA